MATPTSHLSTDLPGSLATSMLPLLLQMPRTPIASERPQKKRKRDTITSIAKQLVEIQQQTVVSLANIQRQTKLVQQQTELALAQMQADNAKERRVNIEIHRMASGSDALPTKDPPTGFAQ